jgi:hypothetical protein
MTVVHFLKKNNFATYGRYKMVSLVFTMERNLRKYLAAENDARVRQYIIATHVFWPNSSELPISMKLFKKSLNFLESRGWHMHLSEDHANKIGKYITRIL